MNVQDAINALPNQTEQIVTCVWVAFTVAVVIYAHFRLGIWTLPWRKK
jgi:hypothetical protein